MSFTTEIYDLLVRYTKDLDDKDITLEDLYKLPWWRCVWGNWKAQAYYKMNGFYERVADVPDGLTDYTIMDMVKTHHFVFNGQKITQIMTKSECKSIYGSVI